MILQNDRYTVTQTAEIMQPLEKYDIVHNPKNVDTQDFYSARVLRIRRQDGTEMTVAVLDLSCSWAESCAVLEGNILTTILYSSIARIDLDTGMMVLYVECDGMGELLEIHPIPEGYILYGEEVLLRYDRALNRLWWRGGRDIFASPTGEKAFWIQEDQIHCRDWEGWHYVLDLEGRWISEAREMSPDS